MCAMKSRLTMISDDVEGGAATACRRLTAAVREASGFEVTWVACKSRGLNSVIPAGEWPSVADFLAYRMVSRFNRCEAVNRRMRDRMGNHSVFTAVRRQAPDLVHLHGLHEAMSFRVLSLLVKNTPLIMTLHDMWPLTGYCYYSYDCTKYTLGCEGNCPQMGECGAAVRSPSCEWRQRERAVSKCRDRLVLVAPSRWMAHCAERRFGGRVRVEHIAYGIDLNVFKPVGARSEVRALLGLPCDRPMVLTGAAVLGDNRKGTSNLPDLMAHIRVASGLSPLLVVVGGGAQQCGLTGDVLQVGAIRDEGLINLYYNAADVFVLPTKADNLPNMLLEALSAGTPCVATDVGGCRDAVVDGETGCLVVPGDSGALARAIGHMLGATPAEGKEWAGRCRAYAEREFDSRKQAIRNIALYEELSCKGVPG